MGEPSAARAPTLSLGLPAVSPGQVTRVSNAHHRAAVGRQRGWRIGTWGEFRSAGGISRRKAGAGGTRRAVARSPGCRRGAVRLRTAWLRGCGTAPQGGSAPSTALCAQKVLVGKVSELQKCRFFFFFFPLPLFPSFVIGVAGDNSLIIYDSSPETAKNCLSSTLDLYPLSPSFTATALFVSKTLRTQW